MRPNIRRISLGLLNVFGHTPSVRLYLVGFLLALLAGSSCIPFGDAWLNITGIVRESSGTTISGASVQVFIDGELKGENAAATTNDHGEYRIHAASCPCDFAFELRVTKPGYKVHVFRARGRDANALHRHDVTLQRLRSAG